MIIIEKIKSLWKRISQAVRDFIVSKKATYHVGANFVWWFCGGIITAAILIVIVVGIGLYHYGWTDKFTRGVSRVFLYPAAIVGTKVIPYYQFQEKVDIATHFYQQTGQAITDTKVLRQPILDEMIEYAILELETPKYHIKVSQQEINDQYTKILAENGGAENVEKLLKELYGINSTAFKQLIREQLLKEKAKDEIPLQLHAKHILVKIAPDANAVTYSQKLAQINDIAQKIKDGMSFEDAAKQFSEDDTTKNNGGDLGWIVRGQVVVCSASSNEFDDAAFSLQEGKISNAVKTSCGYHLIKIDEKKGWVDKNYDQWLQDVKSQINTWRIIK